MYNHGTRPHGAADYRIVFYNSIGGERNKKAADNYKSQHEQTLSISGNMDRP
jgi:hypothetical protein